LILKARRALVTGGAGFIGSHLVDRLVEAGWLVSVLDNLSTGKVTNIRHHLENKRVALFRGSIVDEAVVRRSLDDAHTVFHLAAISGVTESVTDPEGTNETNVHGIVKLLDEARRRDVESIVFVSSAAVYGSSHTPPLRETLAPRPESPYGASKLAGEAYCSAFSSTYGIRTIVLRYFNVYGPRSKAGQEGGVMMEFARRLSSGEPLRIFGDGRQTRDFVHVSDVVDATVRAAGSNLEAGEVLNVGSGKGISINELAASFLKESGSPRRNVLHLEAGRGEIRNSWASVSRAKSLLGYHPRMDLSTGIRELLSWYRSEAPERKGAQAGLTRH
jgi:UDP-glucose 4-epimerase